jgi:hypothetical protein
MARREIRAVPLTLRRGEWSPEEAGSLNCSHVGLLVLDGVLAREIVIEDTISTELLGPWRLHTPLVRRRVEPAQAAGALAGARRGADGRHRRILGEGGSPVPRVERGAHGPGAGALAAAGDNVSTALAALERQGKVRRREDATWLLTGDPPGTPVAQVRRVVSHRRRLMSRQARPALSVIDGQSRSEQPAAGSAPFTVR